ncbi:MAG TPA: hypothetical protein VNK52_12745 [Hyphomicrobiaceae bacterium]|nr:hypothetical protein [Hyphomicrobiaceae bacterium]
MSETDDRRFGTAAAQRPAPAARSAFRCEAHEVKAILQRIATRIHEADRRHSDALEAMHERLLELSRERGGRRPVTAGHTRGIEHSEASAPIAEDEPWDRVSAEALASVYESEGAIGRRQTHGWRAESEAEHLWPAKPAGPTAESERRLLEQMHAELAERLEQALAEVGRECRVSDLAGRFERLEADVGRLLVAAEERTAQEALERIEKQVVELAQRFEAVQGEVQRFGRLEEELGDLARQVSDERMEELLARAAPATREKEKEALAQVVADRVCAQMRQADVLRAGECTSLEELHDLISGFFNERREGDAQTATVLDTMQQAMIRLLDRMDAIEEGSPVGATQRGLNESGKVRFTPGNPSAGPQPWGGGTDPEPAAVDSQEPRFDPAVYHMYPEPDRGARHTRTGSDTDDPHRSGDSPLAEGPPTSWQGDRLDYIPPSAHDAQNVVAAARRVMRQSMAGESGEQRAGGGEQQGGVRPPRPAEKRSGLLRRSWFPSRLFVATFAMIVVGATFAIATVLSKPEANAPFGRMLPTPEKATVEPTKHDAGGGQKGGQSSSSPVPVPQGEPKSNGGAAPALRQRSGEPPKRMHAMGVDRLEWGPEQLSAFQAVGGPASAEGEEGASPIPSEEARLATGSIGVVPKRALGAGAFRMPGSAPEAGPGVGTLPPAAVGPHSLRLAAANGDPSAAFEVGSRLAEGRGVPQDFEQAAIWYQRAAERGFAPAQYRLATLLERGLGVASDLARARAWYLQAAEQGHVKAMHNVAVLSIAGERGSPDYAGAVDWFTKAAEHGLVDSQYNLGVLYESGLGVPRDLKTAYRWFALAARTGDGEARRRCGLLKARIDAADLQEVEAAVASWRAKPMDLLVNEPRTAGALWQREAAAERER